MKCNLQAFHSLVGCTHTRTQWSQTVTCFRHNPWYRFLLYVRAREKSLRREMGSRQQYLLSFMIIEYYLKMQKKTH